MKTKERLVYIASFINFSYGLEWMADNVDKDKYEVDFVFLNKEVPEIYQRLQKRNINVHFIRYRGKRDLLKVIMQLFYYFRKNKPRIIHSHLFDASIAAIPAAWVAGVKKRIHTRHHAIIHHESHPHAIKYDRLINFLSTAIVAVSENVKNILVKKEHVHPDKVFVVHHGFDFDIMDVKEEAISEVRKKYELEGFYPVVGVISRFVEWKGIQYIIPAFKKLLVDFPGAKLVLANAGGAYKEEILKLLSELPARNYIVIEFEQQIYSLIQCFNLFVHVPLNAEAEAFGQVYIEVMRCRVPMICTMSGVASTHIVDRENALVVPYHNSESIYRSMLELIDNSELRRNIIDRAYKEVSEEFSIKKMTDELEQLYEL